MKRLLVFILISVFALGALTACGNGSDPHPDVVKYVDLHGDELLTSLEQSFAISSGRDCKCSIKVRGDGIVVDIKIDGINNVDDKTRDAMQEAYDGMSSVFQAALEGLQNEEPAVGSLQINVCETDGDIIAVINAD